MLISLISAFLITATNLSADKPEAEFLEAVSDLEGAWSGVLVYRDYQTDARVELPHTRQIHVAPDGSYLVSEMAFTDPGYVVYNAQITSIGVNGVQIAYAGGGEVELTATRVTTFEAYGDGWRAVLEGATTDDNAPVDVQFIYTLQGDRFTRDKVVRPEGEADFAFRNGIEVTRAR